MENKFCDEINKITKEAKEMFLKTSDRLFLERVEKDYKLAKQYSGREILELLQNIDDAYYSDCGSNCVASFELEDNCLTVSNYGKPFTLDTLKRLCQGSVSSKEGKYIGCKGIGFRSVLNWSDKIEIYSGDKDYIAVQFSSEYAKDKYGEIKDNVHIQSQVKELEKKHIDSSFPIFKAPKPIDPIDKKYDTVIKIYIKDDIRSKIQDSIESFDKYSLLFLPNIQKIIFKDNEQETTYSKKIDGDTVTIKSNENAGESFYYFEDNSQTIEESINGTSNMRMAVAIPTEATDKDYNLYTFFPILNIKSPFKALLHATFSLNANRNNFESSNEDDKINRAVFLKLLEFYISKVVSLELMERRLQLLKPNNYVRYYSFPDDLARLTCEKDYLDLCKKEKVFYSINGKYLIANGDENSPVIINDDIPDIIKQSRDNFSRLVVVNKVNNTEKIFAEELITNAVKAEDYLFDAINSCFQDWEPKDRISVFKWWNANRYAKLPNLIKDSKGNFISDSKTACFLSGSITDLPEWANINIVNCDDEKELLSQYDQEIAAYKQKNKSNDVGKRILPRLIESSLINLQEQSSKQVMISPVNNSVGSDNENAKEYIKWLWEIWKQEEKFDDTIKNNVKFVVPTADSTVKNADETYIGESFYGNKLGEQLFSQLSFEMVFTPNFIKEEEKGKFIRFLSDIGVSKYPKISSIKIENISMDYINHIKTKHAFECGPAINHWNVKVMYNSKIVDILKNVDTKTILQWILSDKQLKTQIVLDEEPEKSYAEYKPRIPGKTHCDRWNNGWNLPSYIRYIFSIKQWVELKGKRYAPSQLMIASDSNIEGINCITEEDIERFANDLNVNYEELKQIITVH